jgi:hypothetical protein
VARITCPSDKDAYFLRTWDENFKPSEHLNPKVQKVLNSIQQAKSQQRFFKSSHKLLLNTTFKDIKKLPRPLSQMLHTSGTMSTACQNNINSSLPENGQSTGQ